MKVALYVHDIGPEIGGGHTYAGEVLEAVASIGSQARHEIVVASPGPESSASSVAAIHLPKPDPGHRARSQRVRDGFVRIIRRTPDSVTATDVLARNAVDLVWSVGPWTPTYDLPYVPTIWDLQHRLQPVFPEVASGSEWDDREAHFRRMIGGATAIVVGTKAGQAEVERFYGVPPSRIRHLPHPTPGFALSDMPPHATDALERYGLRPGFIFYPAQFWAHKNHVALLHAIRLLEDVHGVRLEAVFVGSDRGNEDHVRGVTRDLGLSGRVHHLGFVPRQDLVELYRNAFALAYPSYFGPENLPPLEAFALGCPVVAADVDGSAEQLGDAALLVAPDDDAGIAKALLSLHADADLRSAIVERGKRRARSFTAHDYAAGMMEILDQLQLTVRTWR